MILTRDAPRRRRHLFCCVHLQVAPGISDRTGLTRGETQDKKHRPQNGFKLNDSTVWYDLRCGDGDNELNWGFWGMLCGPEKDTTKEQRFKYQQDAVSLNTKLRETVCTCMPLCRHLIPHFVPCLVLFTDMHRRMPSASPTLDLYSIFTPTDT